MPDPFSLCVTDAPTRDRSKLNPSGTFLLEKSNINWRPKINRPPIYRVEIKARRTNFIVFDLLLSSDSLTNKMGYRLKLPPMAYRRAKIIPKRLAGLLLTIGLHIAALHYLIDRTNRWPVFTPPATSFKVHIVEGANEQREQLKPIPLNLEISVPNISSPELAIAQEHRNSLPTMQLLDNHAQMLTAPIIATTGPRPDPRLENIFPNSDYPREAKNAGQTGSVVLSLQILTDGSVGDAQIETSSGFESLDKAAARYALLHWHFIPGTRNGEPTVDWRKVSVVFSTDGVSIKY